MSDKIVARFKPDHEGSYLGGVPARSLDEDDMKALTPEQREAVKNSKLYTVVDSPKASAPAESGRSQAQAAP